MTIGEAIEWVAGALLVTAALLSGGEAAGFWAAGAFAFYEAQCLAGSPLNIRKRTKADNSE